MLTSTLTTHLLWLAIPTMLTDSDVVLALSKAPLASSLAGFFRETGGQWGPHPRTSPGAPVWPTASANGFFASEKGKP